MVFAAATVSFHSPQTTVVEASSHKGREAGAILFRERGCEHCHGVDGIGTDLGPDLSTIGRHWKKSAIEQQIVKGGNGMPAFGNVLAPDEVSSLVAYLKAKRKAPKYPVAPPAAAPEPKPTQPPGTDPGF